MKNKKICAIILTLILSMNLVACQNKGKEQQIITQEHASASVTEEDKNEVSYKLTQELNILDDNYRNYYEIFVYSFYDSNGDGIGDINGVTEKLDYIKDMGFNGIWLMPVFESPSYHKYDAVDYFNIDPEYGSNEDMKRLIDECHNRNIRIILDLAINHTSSKHTWFKEASKYLRELPQDKDPNPQECKYVDYYKFSKEKLSSDYYNVLSSNWFYEGVFWSEMPDLNLASTSVREEIENIAEYWLDMGIDGFRMDAAMHYEESNIAFNTEVMNWFFNYCKSINSEAYMVSEVWSGQTDIANYYSSLTPSMFNFAVAGSEGKLIKAGRGKYKAASFVENMLNYEKEFGEKNPDFIDAPFLTNHDMPRVANNLLNNIDDMKMACGLMMTMNGSPFVYYGEEIGMQSKGDKDENKRLPMIWSSTDYTGMTKGPKDADKNINSKFSSVEEQMQDNNSLLNYYKSAIRLRNENPEIARGKIEIIEGLCDGHQAVITKTYDNSTIAICYNTSNESIEIDLTGSPVAKYELRGYQTIDGSKVILENGKITLPSKAYCILK